MKYKFIYYFKEEQREYEVEIEAENDTEAVLKFYDKIGIAEFGCIREDGQFFTDYKFPIEREKILKGC